MKRFYSLLAILLISGKVIFSQILTVNHPVTGYQGPANVKLNANITITNSGSQTLNVLCERIAQNIQPGHYSYFCWLACYDTAVSLSPDPITINAGASTSVFEGWMGTDNTPGHDEITYRFYDMNGLSDTLVMVFVYDFSAPTSSVADISSSKFGFNISGANPANVNTAISYTIPAQKDARVVITNLLGSKVNEIRLNTKSNSLTLPVTDMKSGIYVYSLMVDGRIVSSKKLVVAHQ
jgi:hypothetical protein